MKSTNKHGLTIEQQMSRAKQTLGQGIDKYQNMSRAEKMLGQSMNKHLSMSGNEEYNIIIFDLYSEFYYFI